MPALDPSVADPLAAMRATIYRIRCSSVRRGTVRGGKLRRCGSVRSCRDRAAARSWLGSHRGHIPPGFSGCSTRYNSRPRSAIPWRASPLRCPGRSARRTSSSPGLPVAARRGDITARRHCGWSPPGRRSEVPAAREIIVLLDLAADAVTGSHRPATSCRNDAGRSLAPLAFGAS